MAYPRTKWTDHVVENPNTYKETANGDGTVTHEPAYGEVVQQGTPMSAGNFNNIEEALQHLSVAYDMLFSITQAQLRAQADRIEELETATSALTT